MGQMNFENSNLVFECTLYTVHDVAVLKLDSFPIIVVFTAFSIELLDV